MAAYNIYEAKSQLSSLVEKAAAGEEVIIAKAGRPVARLVPLADPEPLAKREFSHRKLVEITYLSPEFDKPMDDQDLAEWGL